MKRTIKKIISFVLALCMILTGTLSGVTPRESAYGAETLEKLTFTFHSGDAAEKYIQVKTNISTADVVGISFLNGDNGSNIDDYISDDKQRVGYVSMSPVNGIYVFTFNYNKTINAGDEFIMRKGSLFCLKNTSGAIVKYELDKTYKFTYNGTSFSMETVKPEPVELKLEYRYGTERVIQYNTNLPADITLKDFTIDENGCKVTQEGKTVGWVSMIKADDGKIVLAFNFNEGDEFVAGGSYTLKAGSIFGFTDTDQTYKLNSDIKMNFDGTKWTKEEEIKEFSLNLVNEGSTDNYIKFKTTLPTDTPCANFLAGADQNDIDESGNKYLNVAWIEMSKETTINFGFNFNDKKFLPGQSYCLPQGAIFGFTDGKKYKLDKDYTFWYDGYKWTTSTKVDGVEKITVNNEEKTVEKRATMSAGYTQDTLVQFGNFYDFGLPKDNTPINFVGTMYVNGVKISEPQVIGYGDNATTICFNNLKLPNNTLTIMGGSIIYYGDKAVIIEETFHQKVTKTVDGTNASYSWSDGKKGDKTPVILGDANANLLINIKDLVSLKIAQKNGEVTVFNDLVTDGVINKWDAQCMRKVLSNYIVDTKEVSTSSSAYLLDESNFNGGEDFITFADRPADPTDTNDIEQYKALGFNTSLVTGEHGKYRDYYYSVTTSDKKYTLQEGEQELEFTLNAYDNVSVKDPNEDWPNYIQIKTNITANQGDTFEDFLTDQAGDKGHTFLYEKSDNAKVVGYFQFGELGEGEAKAVYFTPHINGINEYSASYTFKAGTKFKVNETTYYALTRDYTFKWDNDYRKGIENLDAKGLNVWLRTTSNKKDYLTDEFANLIAPYKDIIDGMYMNDEPFETEELYTYSKEKYNADEATESFNNLSGDMATWFNTNLSNKYFHVNHVPVTSYNHYGTTGLKAINYTSYSNMFSNYKTTVLDNVTATDKQKTIGFDNYPFGYSTKGKFLFWDLDTETFHDTGLEPTYLVNLLIPAQTAKANNNTYSVCIQTYDKVAGSKTRVVDSKQEVTMQLYSSMACGASMFEYFLYHAQPSTEKVTGFDGIIDLNGNKKTIYDATKQANSEAFPFANIINTFDWQGAEIITGSDSKNSEAIKNVKDSGLTLVLNDSNDGVLSASSATNDALVGYYTKGAYNGYMLANFNDPKVVSTDNKVKLTFAGCNTARVYTSESGKFTTKVVELAADGSYEFTLKPGGGCFVIPVNAN